MMRADLHTHTVYSDGELIPAELVRRAKVLGHDAVALTDHVDMTNVEWVVTNIVKAAELSDDSIEVLPGVEITHVPPSKMEAVVREARRLGARIVVVHGETPVEPVEKGTNRAACIPDVDILAHPGMITVDDAQAAKDAGVALEISGRAGHSLTNGHVAAVARAVGAEMVVDSDTHAPENLMDEAAAMAVALGAGLTVREAERAVRVSPYGIIGRR